MLKPAPERVPSEQASVPMKLSTAIRLGAMLKPQAYDGSATDATCALRAACEALGIKDERRPTGTLNYTALRAAYPLLWSTEHGCPACVANADGADVLDRVYHLNDWHRWTRERIADWIATIEPQEPAVEAPQATTQEEARC